MKNQYHILNGDSLKDMFPEDIKGEIIVARECLVDGNVNGSTLTDLFQTRAKFISSNYKDYNEEDYYKKTVSEFQKIENIVNDSEINLWFEDDLFCQVNFWFIVNLLNETKKNATLFLIRPLSHTPYGFGGLDTSELISAYKNRLLLTELDTLAGLWKFYQTNNTEKLFKTAKELEHIYPFIVPAVEAHMERIPSKGKLGRPYESLIQIMNDLNTQEFGPVFKEFCKRESIYGFGDLQVKRLFDEIKSSY